MRVLHRRIRVRDDRGAQMVEFALIFTFVLMPLVLGIINFGYIFGQQLSLNQAAREGARKAVVSSTTNPSDVDGFVWAATGGLIPNPENPTTGITVESDTQTQVNGPPLTFTTFTTSGNKTCADGSYTAFGGQLQVTATYQAKWLVPTYIPLNAPRLKAVAVFRCEAL